MKKYISIILMIITCMLLCGCELFGSSKQKVTFNYNCEGLNDYSCQIEDNKLNCMFILPKCKEKTFAGWYDAKTNGNPVNLDADFTEGKIIYAQWKEDQTSEITTPDKPSEPEESKPIVETIKYTISFNTNGGSGGQSSSLEVKYNEMVPNINKSIPTRSGYTFMGWYDNSEYTRGKAYYNEKCEAVKDYDRGEDITLYAGWKENSKPVEPEPEPNTEVVKYKISFNMNNGTGTEPNEISVTYNGTLPNISTKSPQRTGYEFMGWYDNSDYIKGNKYYSTDGKSVRTFNRKENIILYAGWKIKTYSITYNLNGGSSGQSGSLSVTYKGSLPSINKSKPIRNGYTFKGWYDNSDYTKGTQYYNENGEPIKKYDKTSDLTLYAGWSKVVVVQTYEVTFNINEGAGTTPGVVNAVLGSKMPSITSTVPTRSGYEFMGWYDNADYAKGTQYYTSKNASARNYDKTTGMTLYAGWKKDVYTLYIQYNGNGGTWNTPKNDTYGINSEGYATDKKTGKIFNQAIKYGATLPTGGVVDYNGSYMNWTYTGHYAEKAKEYIIVNGSTKTEINQNSVYSAIELAKFGGCDLSKKDCTIVLKVNWKADPANYVIKYNCNGGSGTAPANQKVKVGKKYTLNKNTCTKTYRKFAGWVDPTNKVWKNKQSGTWNYHNGDNGIVNGTLELKAKWENPLSANDTARKPTSKYAGECSSKTSGGIYNNVPFLNVGEYCSFESPTLKYYIEQTTRHHRTTYIWVRNAYDQMRVAMTETNEDGTHKTQKSKAIMKHEISSKGYKKKGLIGVNASAMIPWGDSNPPITWNGQPRINLFINEGKVIRYDPNTFWFHQRHYGLASDGILKDYYMGKTKDLKKAEKVKKQILKDKVKYTFGWLKPLIKDGKSGYNASSPGDWDSTNMLMSLCQIDLNNFVIFSSSSAARTKEQGAISYHQEADLLLNLGCKYAYGLDSGGSTSFFYKSRSTKLYGPGNLYDNRNIVDIVYFVEQ